MAAKNSLLSEEEIEKQEGLIPVVAASATRAAHLRALASGISVLLVRNGSFIKARADGSFTEIGKTKPSRHVTVGQVIAVRHIGPKESASARE